VFIITGVVAALVSIAGPRRLCLGRGAADRSASLVRLAAVDPFQGQSPEKIKAEMISVARSATSVRIKTSLKERGETVDMDAVISGCQGKIRIASSRKGTEQIIRNGDDLYISGDKKAWVVSGKTTVQASALVGKWVKLTVKDPGHAYARDLTWATSWADSLTRFKPTKRLIDSTIGTTKAVGLYGAGGEGGKLYLAATGKPFPLSMVSNDGSVQVSFSHWNEAAPIDIPSSDAVVGR
jgi:hypothetical protein